MLAEIFARHYFTRAWTLQEVVMGPMVLLVCGEEEMPWDRMAYAMAILIEIERNEASTRQHESAVFNLILPYRSLRARTQRHIREAANLSQLPVALVLAMTTRLNVNVPQDKFYAIYGILSKMGLMNLPAINYSKPLGEVYAEASERALCHDTKLDLMCFLGVRHDIPGLPSWALDLNMKHPAPVIQCDHSNASLTSTPIIYPLGCGQLATRGKTVGSVSRRAKRTLPSDLNFPARRTDSARAVDLEGLEQRIQAYLEWVVMYKEETQLLSEQEALHRFRDVLTQGNFLDGPSPQRLPEKDLQYFEHWVVYLLAYGGCLSEDAAEPINQEIERNAWLASELPDVKALYFGNDVERSACMASREWKVLMAWSNSPIRPVHVLVHKMTMGHTFFFSSNGNMGIGTNELQVDDRIVLFCGAPTPMIVRAVEDDRFKIVGPAYIEGLMQGECWSAEGLEDVLLI